VSVERVNLYMWIRRNAPPFELQRRAELRTVGSNPLRHKLLKRITDEYSFVFSAVIFYTTTTSVVNFFYEPILSLEFSNDVVHLVVPVHGRAFTSLCF
jgi:hypothetical protein